MLPFGPRATRGHRSLRGLLVAHKPLLTAATTLGRGLGRRHDDQHAVMLAPFRFLGRAQDPLPRGRRDGIGRDEDGEPANGLNLHLAE